MTSTGSLELGSAILFCVGLKKSPTETFRMVNESETLPSCSRSFVFKWHERFRSGRTSVTDDERPGRPSLVLHRNKERVQHLINNDRRLTVRTISEKLGISRTAVHEILTDELGMSKVSARWVPRLLSADNRQRRVECSSAFLSRYEQEGDSFLDRIVTTDESWMHHFDPETKRESSVWKTPSTPPPKKARVQKSCGKEMFILFMDRRGMLLQHRVRDGCTVNAAYYSEVIRRDLVQALRRKRPDLELERVVLHQDNAPAHRAESTQLDIALLGFEVLEHPPYSPDLAPLDFRVFPEVKAQLRGRHFEDTLALQNAVRRAVEKFDSNWYLETYAKWVRRHRKCVATGGDYVEKVNRCIDFSRV